MGYSTDFAGALEITPALTKEQVEYVNRFSSIRHMRRNAEITATYPDPIREAVGLPVGHEGCYYVGTEETNPNCGQEHTEDVLDFNEAAGAVKMNDGEAWADFFQRQQAAIKAGSCQPGLWCQWIITENGTQLEWDGGEKFYEYEAWLQWMIDHFFNRWGVKLNGKIDWRGDNFDDMGSIIVKDSKVKIKNLSF